jgi:hypothetical protein
MVRSRTLSKIVKEKPKDTWRDAVMSDVRKMLGEQDGEHWH